MKKVMCVFFEGMAYVPLDAVEELIEASAAPERANNEIDMLRKERDEAMWHSQKLRTRLYKLADENESLRLAAKVENAPGAAPLPTFQQTFSGQFCGSCRMWTRDEIEKIAYDIIEKRMKRSQADAQYLRNLTDEVIESVAWAACRENTARGDAQP